MTEKQEKNDDISREYRKYGREKKIRQKNKKKKQ